MSLYRSIFLDDDILLWCLCSKLDAGIAGALIRLTPLTRVCRLNSYRQHVLGHVAVYSLAGQYNFSR
jgi:hypothetical protein